MNIQQFIHKIGMNIPESKAMTVVYQHVNLYFGTLAYFHSHRIEEGIIIFREEHKFYVSPLFNKTDKICSHCFLEHRNQFKSIDVLGRGNELIEIEVCNLFEEKLLCAISQLIQFKSKPPLFDYFIIDDYQISRHQFFRIANCDICISEDEEVNHTFINRNHFIQASSLREKLGNYQEYIQLDNKDSGLFKRELTTFLKSAIAVELQFSFFKNEMISGIGIDRSYNKARAKAFLEAMERYCGIISKGQRRLLFSLNELDKKTIEYLNPNDYLRTHLKPTINQEVKIHWLPAYHYQTQTTTLIPEDFIIYKTQRKPMSKKLVNMSSNGHAIGSSYKEAVIFSLFELYERDYFLVHWYENRAPKEIRRESIVDIEINRYLILIKHLGYEVSIYQLLSTDIIKIYWIFARGKTKDQFATYSTAGAHLFGKSAMMSALKELYYALYIYDKDVVYIKEKSRQMNSQDVISVADHSIYYSVEEGSHHFDFLNEAESIDFKMENDDITDIDNYYLELLEFTNEHFGDFYIVDNTPIGLIEMNLCEVKVFVPAMQEMYFGYDNQYINHRRVQLPKNKEPKIHPFP